MIEHSPLGKTADYAQTYSPDILFSIPRSRGREALPMANPLPFSGVDLWTGYEISWLNRKNKPMVAVGEFRIPAITTNIIESKSFKLYLNSFNATQFDDVEAVQATLARDLSHAAAGSVRVRLILPGQFGTRTEEMAGACIDDADIEVDAFDIRPEHLSASGERVEEALCSDLLRSNCPVTGQPDWASVMVHYRGPRIDRDGLLKYIVSYRQHTGFHEQCVEQMFLDIKARCRCENLTVYARYTRRGGLDINPFRSDFEDGPPNIRNFRQ